MGNPLKPAHPNIVHCAITGNPKYASTASFNASVYNLLSVTYFGYNCTTTSGLLNVLLFITEDGKWFTPCIGMHLGLPTAVMLVSPASGELLMLEEVSVGVVGACCIGG